MRLLLIEDDVMVGAGVRLGLRQEDFVVDWVQDGPAAETALQSESYSVVVLDIGLPRKHCLMILEALHRQSNPVPVVIIDLHETEVRPAMDGGDPACDAVDLDELAARIRAASRRQADYSERGNTIFALPFSWG